MGALELSPTDDPAREPVSPGLFRDDGPLSVDLVRSALKGSPGARIELHYQPLVLLQSGHVCGFEALARIRLADGSLVAPSRFIPLAESTGMIIPLGMQVLSQAVHAAAGWRSASSLLSTATVAVNVAPAQLLQPDFVDDVLRVLAAEGLPGTALVLEITESTASSADVTPVLTRLQGNGIRVALDDFGMGFATLEMLRRIPVQILKLDRMFVRGVEREGADRAIVRAVIDLAESLGLSVTAEGVESQGQVESLARMGCTSAQGSFFSLPGADPVAAAQAAGHSLDHESDWGADEPAPGGVTPEQDAVLLAAARLLAGEEGRVRGAVHALAVAWAREAGLDEVSVRTISRLSLVHDVWRLRLDGEPPGSVCDLEVVRQWMAERHHPVRSEHVLLRLALGLVDGWARSDPALTDLGLAATLRQASVCGFGGDFPRFGGQLGNEVLDGDSLVRALRRVAATPPEVITATDVVADLERRRQGRRGAVDRLRTLIGIARVMSDTGDTREMLRSALEEIRKIAGAASASVERWDRDAGQIRTLVNVGELGPGEVVFPENEVYPLSQYTAARRVLLGGVAYINTIDDVDADPEARELLMSLHKYSSATVPVYLQGRMWGQLWFATAVGEPPFTVGDVEVLSATAGLASVVVAQSEYLDRVAYLAFRDPLTGVANRRSIDDTLRALADDCRAVSVALIDVDALKQINDQHGHEAGDAALLDVAALLTQMSSDVQGACVGRLGGDEFCVVLPDDDTHAMAAGLRNGLAAAVEVLRREGRPTFSFGVAHGPVGWTPRLILASADEELYRAKRVGPLAG